MASAFGGLLASAIANMKMVRGLGAWRWVFILEGIATILVGIASFFLVSDFPETAKWLTEEERAFVMARASASKADGDKITFKAVLLFFTDVKNLLAGIIYFGRTFHPQLKNAKTILKIPQRLSSPFIPSPTLPPPSSKPSATPSFRPNSTQSLLSSPPSGSASSLPSPRMPPTTASHLFSSANLSSSSASLSS